MHHGFNAELTDSSSSVGTANAFSFGWDVFETRTCALAHQSSIVDNIPKPDEYSDESDIDDEDEDNEDDEDSDDESTTDETSQGGKLNTISDSDSDDSDEYDDENEIEINSGKELSGRDKILAEEIDGLNNRLGDCKHIDILIFFVT